MPKYELHYEQAVEIKVIVEAENKIEARRISDSVVCDKVSVISHGEVDGVTYFIEMEQGHAISAWHIKER